MKILKNIKPYLTQVFLMLLGLGLSIGFNILVAQNLSPEMYGNFMVVIIVLPILIPLFLRGAEISTKEFLTQYLDSKKYSAALGFLSWSRQRFLVTILIYAAAYIALSFLFIFSDSSITTRFHFIFFGLILPPLVAGLFYQHCILNSIKYFIPSSFLHNLFFLVFIILSSITIWIYHPIDLKSFFIIYALSCFILIFINHFYIRKYFTKVKYSYKKDMTDAQSWRKTSFSMMSFSLVTLLLNAADIILLKLFGSNETQVGHYAAILALSTIIIAVNDGVRTIIGTFIAPAVAKGDLSQLQYSINTATILKLVIMATIIILFAIFGKNIILLFGPSYNEIYTPMLFMMSILLVSSIFNIANTILVYSGRERFGLAINTIKLLTLLGCGIILIPLFQIYGAILALGISTITGGIVSIILLHRNSTLRIYKHRTV